MAKTAEVVAEVIRLTVAGMSQREIAADLAARGMKVSRGEVHEIQVSSGSRSPYKPGGVKVPRDKDVNAADGTPAETVKEGMVSFSSRGDDAEGEYLTCERPTEVTLESILTKYGVDLTTWAVDRWELKNWTTGMKLKGAGGDRRAYTDQYSIHVKFKRILPKAMKGALDAVYERMRTHAPEYEVPPLPLTEKGLLAGAFLFDVHFGKLAWGVETGENYDLSIVTDRFNNAVDDMVAHAATQNVADWLFPIGNDYFHVDSRRNQTFNGTPQDVDGRYEKMFESGLNAAIRAVELMAVTAPVHVVWVPGNHDPHTSWHLAKTLWAWFANHPRVTVDVGPSPRKYFKWNKCLFGLTHSDKEKVNNLASIMASDRPADWADTVCREWLLGHRHHSEKWQTKPVDSAYGVTLRTIQSLSATDSWHHAAGYVGSPKAAELHYYDADHGHDSYKLIYARGRK